MTQMAWIRALFESCLREIDRWCPHLKHTKYRIGPLTSAKIKLNKRCILISISFWLTTSKTKSPRGEVQNQAIYFNNDISRHISLHSEPSIPSKECLKHSDLLLGSSDDDSDASQDSSVWCVYLCDFKGITSTNTFWMTDCWWKKSCTTWDV